MYQQGHWQVFYQDLNNIFNKKEKYIFWKRKRLSLIEDDVVFISIDPDPEEGSKIHGCNVTPIWLVIMLN